MLTYSYRDTNIYLSNYKLQNENHTQSMLQSALAIQIAAHAFVTDKDNML